MSRLGLEEPESVTEQVRIQADVSAMRKAITFGQRDSTLISTCLHVAENNGLSGEETYVLLAYHALLQVERFWQHELTLTRLDIRAPFVKSVDQPDNT